MSHILDHVPTTAKVAGEALSLGVIGGVLAQVLPPIAAALAIAWHCLMFYEWACKKYGRRKADREKREDAAPRDEEE